MARLLVVLDDTVGVSPERFVELWAAEEEAAVLGTATVQTAAGQSFLPGVVELVAIPIVVSVAADLLSDLVRRLVRRGQPAESSGADLEITEVTTREGDRVVVVRHRSGTPCRCRCDRARRARPASSAPARRAR